VKVEIVYPRLEKEFGNTPVIDGSVALSQIKHYHYSEAFTSDEGVLWTLLSLDFLLWARLWCRPSLGGSSFFEIHLTSLIFVSLELCAPILPPSARDEGSRAVPYSLSCPFLVPVRRDRVWRSSYVIFLMSVVAEGYLSFELGEDSLSLLCQMLSPCLVHGVSFRYSFPPDGST